MRVRITFNATTERMAVALVWYEQLWGADTVKGCRNASRSRIVSATRKALQMYGSELTQHALTEYSSWESSEEAEKQQAMMDAAEERVEEVFGIVSARKGKGR